MKVRLTTSMVSEARPEPGGVDVGVAGEVTLASVVAAWSGEDGLGVAEAGVEGCWLAAARAFMSMAATASSTMGRESLCGGRGGDVGQEVGGGDDLGADVVGQGAVWWSWARCGG